MPFKESIIFSMNILRTIIIDDEKHSCERLKRLLASFPYINVIGCFTNCRQGLESILKQKPDLLFLDVELENNISAFDLLKQLDKNLYRPHIILVTGFPQYSIKAIKNEVFDYIIKPVDIDELKASISRLTEHLSLKTSQTLIKFNMLSKRESEILKHVLEGKTSSEIADLLFISVNTVHTHRRNILKKTGAGSIIDLLRINLTVDD
jgi:DNA-binding NarL/FixJ family response regulator